ncbi:uncharacterized protein LOC118434622 isoform X2 [Folsomia candida]|uniref:uncharacterized protein LOC118434622 isoform X2 n=1 Tax=Folsomia candida TaxID=158441 RepID=UPI001604E386|nr:uncharacterized protein LOC118434622 isoform X2 [Folsomia candida]
MCDYYNIPRNRATKVVAMSLSILLAVEKLILMEEVQEKQEESPTIQSKKARSFCTGFGIAIIMLSLASGIFTLLSCKSVDNEKRRTKFGYMAISFIILSTMISGGLRASHKTGQSCLVLTRRDNKTGQDGNLRPAFWQARRDTGRDKQRLVLSCLGKTGRLATI